MRPMRLRNTEGRWRVIVNKIGLYDQTVRVETCLNNGSNCRLLPPCYNTQVLDRVVLFGGFGLYDKLSKHTF